MRSLACGLLRSCPLLPPKGNSIADSRGLGPVRPSWVQGTPVHCYIAAMLAIVANWFRRAPVGIVALSALLSSFSIIFSIGSRYCFATDGSWVARSVHTAAWVWIASGITALVAIFLDQKRRYAVITLICWLSSLYLISFSSGCF